MNKNKKVSFLLIQIKNLKNIGKIILQFKNKTKTTKHHGEYNIEERLTEEKTKIIKKGDDPKNEQ